MGATPVPGGMRRYKASSSSRRLRDGRVGLFRDGGGQRVRQVLSSNGGIMETPKAPSRSARLGFVIHFEVRASMESVRESDADVS